MWSAFTRLTCQSSRSITAVAKVFPSLLSFLPTCRAGCRCRAETINLFQILSSNIRRTRFSALRSQSVSRSRRNAVGLPCPRRDLVPSACKGDRLGVAITLRAKPNQVVNRPCHLLTSLIFHACVSLRIASFYVVSWFLLIGYFETPATFVLDC